MEALAHHIGKSDSINVTHGDPSSSFSYHQPPINFSSSIQSSSTPAWLTSALLLLVSLIGLPLNGTTVVIFWRRKKLRHLVNFVLLLDCLSHIILCLVCIPIQVIVVWLPPGKAIGLGSVILFILQQVVGNFANLCGLFLTLSIGILRYRRLCWKKKDKFSTTNAIKWSVASGSLAIGFAVLQIATSLLHHPPLPTLTLYSIKLALILLSVLAVFFCYIRVAQRVWSSGTNQEKLMDANKLKKSRSIHLRATFHSCIQIILVVATLSPYLYQETIQAFGIGDSEGCRLYHGAAAASSGNLLQPSISPSSIQAEQGLSLEDMRYNEMRENDNNNKNPEDFSQSNPPTQQGYHWWHSFFYFYCNSLPTSTDRLLAVTINYSLLILGTPLAYIASCHRFREQFKSLLFFRGRSPPGSPSYRRHHHVKDGRGGTPPVCRSQRISSMHHHNHHPRSKYFHHRRGTETNLRRSSNFSQTLSLSHPNLSSITLHPSMIGIKRKSSLIACGGESNGNYICRRKNNHHSPDFSATLHSEKAVLIVSEMERVSRRNHHQEATSPCKKSSSSGSTSPLSLNSDHVLPESGHHQTSRNSGKTHKEFTRSSLGSSFHSGSSSVHTTSTSGGNLTKEASLSSTSGSISNSLLHQSPYSNNNLCPSEPSNTPPPNLSPSPNQLTRSRNSDNFPIYITNSNFMPCNTARFYGHGFGDHV